MPEKNAWKRGRAAAFRSGCSARSHKYGICCKLVRLEVLLRACGPHLTVQPFQVWGCIDVFNGSVPTAASAAGRRCGPARRGAVVVSLVGLAVAAGCSASGPSASLASTSIGGVAEPISTAQDRVLVRLGGIAESAGTGHDRRLRVRDAEPTALVSPTSTAAVTQSPGPAATTSPGEAPPPTSAPARAPAGTTPEAPKITIKPVAASIAQPVAVLPKADPKITIAPVAAPIAKPVVALPKAVPAGPALPALSAVPAATSPAGSARAVSGCANPNGAKVLLTFDDGGPQARAILSILDRYNIKARWFPTGQWAGSNGPFVARLLGDGQMLGNHTYSHPQMLSSLDTAELQRQVNLGYHPTNVFRFPYGASDAGSMALVTGMGYSICGWSIDTLDWSGNPAATIADIVTSQARAGSVVLMHLSFQSDVDALPGIIDNLRARALI